MKALKWILIGLVALAVILLGAVYFVLSSYDDEELKTIIQTEAKAATGRDLAINGPIDIGISLSPSLTVEDVTFANATWGSEPSMASMKRFEMELSLLSLLGGQITVNRLVLVEPDILLETNRQGTGNWEFASATPADETAEEAGPPVDLSINDIIIENGNFTYRDGVTGDSFDISLAELTGQIVSSSQVNLSANGAVGESPYTLEVSIAGSGNEFRLDNLDLTYAGSDLSGTGSLSMAGAKPRVTGEFSSDTIDLGALMGPPAEEEEAAGPVFSDEPLPVEGLKSVNADISIAAANLLVSEAIRITDVELGVTLNGGRLDVSPIKGALFKGTVDGALALDGSRSPARLSSDLKVRDLDYGEVLKSMDISENVDGSIEMTVDVTGSGTSMKGIASTMNGSAEMIALDGIINSRLLGVLSNAVGDAVGPLLGGRSSVPLHCAVVRLGIENGMGRTLPFVVDAETFALVGGGDVNLGTEKLDLVFDTRTHVGSIASLAVPIRVTGDLASPNATPDPAATLNRLGQLFGGSSEEDGDGGMLGKIGGLLGKATGGGGAKSQLPPEDLESGQYCDWAFETMGRAAP